MSKLVIQVLGSGSSTGVPIVGCRCKVCSSANPKDKRKRASLLVKDASTQVIIDTGPDFRQQCLENSIVNLDSVLYTHSHYDHIGGIDELRCFSVALKKSFPLLYGYYNKEYCTKKKSLYV